jgi:hypothetical protein
VRRQREMDTYNTPSFVPPSSTPPSSMNSNAVTFCLLIGRCDCHDPASCQLSWSPCICSPHEHLPCFINHIRTPNFGNETAIRSRLYASAVGVSSGAVPMAGSAMMLQFQTSCVRGGVSPAGRAQRSSAPSVQSTRSPTSSSIHCADTTPDECGRRATSLYMTLSHMRIVQSAPDRLR